MANREKKVSIGKKQSPASPVPPAEAVGSPPAEDVTKTTLKSASAIAKKLSKTAAKRAIKKNLTIQLKAKTKQQKSKINPKLTKPLLDGKKTGLLKNGLVKVKQIKNKPKVTPTSQQPQQEGDDKPPVLEPIFPVEDNVDKKPQPKKRAHKKPATAEDQKKLKVEEDFDSPKQTPGIKKPKVANKAKSESPDESLEEVMKDLSTLITNNTPKQEVEETTATPTEIVQKPKKYSKKQLDALKRKLLKKENLENTLKKMDLSSPNVIDMLDLNVRKLVSKPVQKRRHSIEKYPLGSLSAPTIAQLTLFNNVPRSISPRAKRSAKVRQSIDNSSRRSSPYTTRSDSPARILRNGKHRKLKDLNLMGGLDIEYKRRKRLCSDLSGSELSVSKVSGYDSDSSVSDMSSLHGTESSDVKDTTEVKKEVDGDVVKNDAFQAVIKADISNNDLPKNNPQENMDTNSNLCSDIKPPAVIKDQEEPQVDNQIKEADIVFENLAVSPSIKVPDKSIILNIMKQTFNSETTSNNNTEEATTDKEKRTTRASTRKSGKTENVAVATSTFYGNAEAVPETSVTTKQSDISEKDVPPVPEELKAEVVPECETSTIPSEELQEVMDTEQIPVSEENEAKPEPPKAEDVAEAVERKEESTSEVKEEAPPPQKVEVVETLEDLAIKENIFQALGLLSMEAAKAAEEAAKLKEEEKERWTRTEGNYTGTLKTVIKINRCETKKNVKTPLKMTLQKNKPKNSDNDHAKSKTESGYKIMKEGSSSTTSKNHSNPSSDTAGGHRKSHYSNRSNMEGSSEQASEGDTAEGQTEGAAKTLVIPEKASSFSIHPGRLCKDECSYCFGKFGLFDTPCHIAQMKSVDRQNKILAAEKHLTRDSCLCDACYRHVDRKSNTPSYSNKSSFKRSNLVAPGPRQNHCHVLGCGRVSSNILRRKWIIKMRKSVCKVINIDLDNPGLHSIPICDEHYAALEHLMVCAMCKRRLARNHIHYLGPECNDLNVALNAEGIPVKLVDKPVVCKLCRYFATLILKDPADRPENTNHFFREYKKRLLHFHDVEVMDKAAAEEPIAVPTKENKVEKEQTVKRKRKTKSQSESEPPVLEPQVEVEKTSSDQSRVPSDANSKSRSESPSDYMIDYKNLIPSIALECGSDLDTSKKETKKPLVLKKVNRPDTVKEAVEISKNLKLKSKGSGNDAAVQRLGSNPSISVRQLFPGEEELPLQGHIDFGNVKERTPEGWEKCTTTIQYDIETKHLWQELQKPYGNQSSFLRHLILLEKYFRSGDLVLGPNATHHSINYSESVQNRLKAYDNIPSVNKPQKSSTTIVPTKEVATSFTIVNAANIPKNTPITISQISNLNKQKAISTPPGLVSLQQSRPVAPPLVKVQQSQKIKFPITKNWRPNLIPIDPNKKIEKKAGLVQVISGGKPYHITIEDYKKMCTIKKNFEMKAKRLQEAQKSAGTSLLKSVVPKKGLVITKTSTNGTEEPSGGSILEKLDRVIEKLDSGDSNHSMILPKIPKSLTVIPQTVARKPSPPGSPILMITPKPKATVKS